MHADHTWNLRVHSDDPGRATVYVRRHRFEVGVPLQFDDEYPLVTALEHALGALAADVVVGLRRVAKRRRVDVDRVEAIVRAQVDNPLTFLQVVGEDGDPGLERIAIKVYVSSVDPLERVEEVWQEALSISPLARTFARSVALELEHEVVI